MFERAPRLADFDPELNAAMQQEAGRQEAHIELIASENYCSPAVMEAQGSQLTNKYAEGYPGKRYYGGCEFVDIAEQLAINRIKQVRSEEHTSELQSLMRISYAVFCLKTKTPHTKLITTNTR